MLPSRNPNFPFDEYSRFDLDHMSEAECKAEFRFDKKDLPVLPEALQIRPSFKLNLGSIVDGMEGLCTHKCPKLTSTIWTSLKYILL